MADAYQPWTSNEPPPIGNTDAWADYLTGHLDPRISREQWRAWVEEGGLDPSCPRNKPFKSQRGNAAGVCVEKPVDCPEGMFLHGENCYKTGETPGGFGVHGRVGGAPGATPAPGSDLLTAPKPVAAPGSDLQAVLEQAFQGRKGMFGWANARGPMSGIAGDLYAKSLGGGGIWWGGEKGMFDPNKAMPGFGPRGRGRPTPAVAPAPAPAPGTAPVPTPLPVTSPLVDSLFKKFRTRPWWQQPPGGILG